MNRAKPDPVKLNEAFSFVHEHLKWLNYHQRQWLLYSIDRLGETLDRNIVVCGGCHELLESTYGHHFVQCKCPCKTMVDGGKEPGGGRYSVSHPNTKHFKTYQEAIEYQHKADKKENHHE